MIKLPHRDLHRLSAAEGWLELGNHVEAEKELDEISPAHHGFSEVLRLRWRIQSSGKSWEDAFKTAALLVDSCPSDPEAWIFRSYALHELNRTAEARDALVKALDQFQRVSVIYYNLACYEAQLGNLDAGHRYLKKAFTLPGGKKLKQGAANDPDLKPLKKHMAGQ
jgi:tetratricopeptide (TPR) repeat protein